MYSVCSGVWASSEFVYVYTLNLVVCDRRRRRRRPNRPQKVAAIQRMTRRHPKNRNWTHPQHHHQHPNLQLSLDRLRLSVNQSRWLALRQRLIRSNAPASNHSFLTAKTDRTPPHVNHIIYRPVCFHHKSLRWRVRARRVMCLLLRITTLQVWSKRSRLTVAVRV